MTCACTVAVGCHRCCRSPTFCHTAVHCKGAVHTPRLGIAAVASVFFAHRATTTDNLSVCQMGQYHTGLFHTRHLRQLPWHCRHSTGWDRTGWFTCTPPHTTHTHTACTHYWSMAWAGLCASLGANTAPPPPPRQLNLPPAPHSVYHARSNDIFMAGLTNAIRALRAQAATLRHPHT